jgi:hypothetical protein
MVTGASSRGSACATDWLSASVMFLGALIISLWTFPLARAGDAKSTGLLAFAAVGATLAIIDAANDER